MAYYLSSLPRPKSRLLSGSSASWQSNDAGDTPIKRTSTTAMIAASENSTTGGNVTIGGGDRWAEITFQERSSATTSSVTVLTLNQLGHPLYATTSGDNTVPVGINRDADPDYLSKFAEYDYMRVRKVRLRIRVAQISSVNAAVELALVPFRADIGLPGGIQYGSTTQRTNVHLLPGTIMWVTKDNGLSGSFALKDGYKEFEFDIPKCFNDVEWMYDNLASTASTTNFWVAKGSGNKLWTAAPNMKLQFKLLARLPRHTDATSSVAITAQISWICEFTRSQATLLPDNEE